MSTLDLRPGVVDIQGYSGDTLTVEIRIENVDLLVDNTFFAQVREDRPDPVVLATFIITPTVTGAYITLPSDVTETLLGTSEQFVGVYDVELHDAAVPPKVMTVVQGKLTLDRDVTRLS